MHQVALVPYDFTGSIETMDLDPQSQPFFKYLVWKKSVAEPPPFDGSPHLGAAEIVHASLQLLQPKNIY